MEAAYLVYRGAATARFWEAQAEPGRLIVRSGVIGGTPRQETIACDDAVAELRRRMARKLKEGYMPGAEAATGPVADLVSINLYCDDAVFLDGLLYIKAGYRHPTNDFGWDDGASGLDVDDTGWGDAFDDSWCVGDPDNGSEDFDPADARYDVDYRRILVKGPAGVEKIDVAFEIRSICPVTAPDGRAAVAVIGFDELALLRGGELAAYRLLPQQDGGGSQVWRAAGDGAEVWAIDYDGEHVLRLELLAGRRAKWLPIATAPLQVMTCAMATAGLLAGGGNGLAFFSKDGASDRVYRSLGHVTAVWADGEAIAIATHADGQPTSSILAGVGTSLAPVGTIAALRPRPAIFAGAVFALGERHLLRFGGRAPKRIRLPTHMTAPASLRVSDGRLIVCSGHGVLISCDGETFEPVAFRTAPEPPVKTP